MSMWADYILEHRGDLMVESPVGFAVYRFLDEKQVYIVDIYVKPEFRQAGKAASIADLVVEAAKRQGCTELLGTVVPSAKNSTASLKVLLGYGMSLKSSSNDLIVFQKAI